jgi:tetratricopeptide (TPR) repeat protein
MVLLLLAYSEYCRIPIFNWLFDDWKVAESTIDEAIKRMPMDALRLPMLVVLKRHPQIAPSCVFEVNRFSSSQYEESKHSPSPNNPRDVSLLTSLKPFARFMLKVYNIRRSEFDSNATYFLATTLRKAGEFSQGLRLLEELHAERPSWKTCIGIGYILREMGELEKAINWFENASTFNPPNISFLLDAADTSLRVDQVPRARTHYLSILNAQPENSWADASVTYISVRFRFSVSSWLSVCLTIFFCSVLNVRFRGTLWGTSQNGHERQQTCQVSAQRRT